MRIDRAGDSVETTFAALLGVIKDASRTDAEALAVLGCMLDEGRIRLLDERQIRVIVSGHAVRDPVE